VYLGVGLGLELGFLTINDFPAFIGSLCSRIVYVLARRPEVCVMPPLSTLGPLTPTSSPFRGFLTAFCHLLSFNFPRIILSGRSTLWFFFIPSLQLTTPVSPLIPFSSGSLAFFQAPFSIMFVSGARCNNHNARRFPFLYRFLHHSSTYPSFFPFLFGFFKGSSCVKKPTYFFLVAQTFSLCCYPSM